MEDKKKLKAQLTNEIARQFKAKVERLEEINKNLSVQNENLRKEKETLCETIYKLTEENEQLKDWVGRMQSFMDMSDEERNEYFKSLKASKEAAEKFNSIMGFYGHITKHLF